MRQFMRRRTCPNCLTAQPIFVDKTVTAMGRRPRLKAAMEINLKKVEKSTEFWTVLEFWMVLDFSRTSEHTPSSDHALDARAGNHDPDGLH